MAYARYDRKSDWHIFWTSEKRPPVDVEDRRDPRNWQILAVAHLKYRSINPELTYLEVRSVLESGDFSLILGYEEEYRGLIVECLREFVQDVDEEFHFRERSWSTGEEVDGPVRMCLFCDTAMASSGETVQVQVGLQNRTDSSLGVTLEGRVLMEESEVSVFPARRIQIGPSQKMELIDPIHYQVPANAPLKRYEIEFRAETEQEDPVFVQKDSFTVYPRSSAEIDATVTPKVLGGGETLFLKVHVRSNTDRSRKYLQRGVIRAVRELEPLHQFEGFCFEVAARESVLNELEFSFPNGAPPGDYVFEVEVNPTDGKEEIVDAKSVRFSVTP